MSEPGQPFSSPTSSTPAWTRWIPVLPGRRRVWETIDIAVPVVGSVFGAIVAVIVRGDQPWAAIGVLGFFVFGGWAKLTSKRLEWRERDEKAKLEAQEREERNQEIEELRAEAANKGKCVVEQILHYFWRRYFDGMKKGDWDLHRVTVFRRVICADSQKPVRLEIYARHGRYRDSATTWEIDQDDRAKCRGIASEIWYGNEVLHRFAACEWSDTDVKKQRKYADSLGISVEEARRLNIKSAAFAGSPIEIEKERWGVILIDSLTRDHVQDTEPKRDLIHRYAEILAILIKET